MLLPSLLPALREVVPAAHGAFFYCDAQGNIVNMYAERMLPPDAMARYHERYFRSEADTFAERYLGRVAAADPVSSRSVTDADRASGYHREVLAQIGVEHMLYGIVRDQQQVIGQLSLYRDADALAFSTRDQQALRDVLHYLGKALVRSAAPAGGLPPAQVAEEGLAVLENDGSARCADENWMRLARMARGLQIAPGSARVESDAIPKFTSMALAAARAAPGGVHAIESAWGRFTFRAFAMRDADGVHSWGLLISRLMVEPVGLAEGAARLGLTPQQREVAMLLTQGESNAGIAARLGVSINTANYHVKRLFSRLGVHERQQIAAVLRDAASSHRSGADQVRR